MVATGPGADRLAPCYAMRRDHTAAAAFGTTLHVCSTDEAALDRAIAPYRSDAISWHREAPTLEDVFIHLMGQAQDNALAPDMGFLARLWAMIVKEALQLKRDRLTFGMMFGVPIMQLVLFGFAINNDPKALPTRSSRRISPP